MPDDLMPTLKEIKSLMEELNRHGDALRWFTFGTFLTLLAHVVHHW